MSQIQAGTPATQQQIDEMIAVILRKNGGDIDVSFLEWMTLASKLNVSPRDAGKAFFELYQSKHRPLSEDEIKTHALRLRESMQRQSQQTKLQPAKTVIQPPVTQAPITPSPQSIPTRSATPVNPRVVAPKFSTPDDYHDLGIRVAQTWCSVLKQNNAVWYLGDFQLSPRRVTLKFDFNLELCSAEQLSKYRKTLMSKTGLPTEATIDAHPGFVGITLPRQNWQPYLLAEQLGESGLRSPTDWPIIRLGVDNDEQLVRPALRNMLIAGSPDAGKSSALKLIVADLMLTYHPNHLRMLLIDIKGESAPELGFFSGLPWLTAYLSTNGQSTREVIRTWEQAKSTLQALKEIEAGRWKKLGEAGCSRIDHYNRMHPTSPIPYLVTVIDEFSLLTEGDQEGANLLEKLTKTGRASGMLYILATQRPSGSAVDQVVTPALSQNFTERLVLRCSTDADYKIALGRRTGSIPVLGERGHAVLATDGQEREIQLLYAPEDWIRASIYQRGAQFSPR